MQRITSTLLCFACIGHSQQLQASSAEDQAPLTAVDTTACFKSLAGRSLSVMQNCVKRRTLAALLATLRLPAVSTYAAPAAFVSAPTLSWQAAINRQSYLRQSQRERSTKTSALTAQSLRRTGPVMLVTEAMLRGGKRGPKARQSLGQNFLVDVHQARRFAYEADGAGEAGSRVIELGPGQGALTGFLLERFPRMKAIELDSRMIEHLQETMPPVTLEHGDMLTVDFAELAAECGGKLSIVSNMPFYLTSQLLFKMLGSIEHVQEAVFSMQLEVGEKILSPPNSKQYHPLSVMIQLFGYPEHLFNIPSTSFSPIPKVSASVFRFRPNAVPAGEEQAFTPAQRATLLGLLKMAFEQRRKMLRKSLKSLLASGKVGTPPEHLLTKRPEHLSPQEWLEFARALFGDDLSGNAEQKESKKAVSAVLESHGHSSGWVAHKAGYAN